MVWWDIVIDSEAPDPDILKSRIQIQTKIYQVKTNIECFVAGSDSNSGSYLKGHSLKTCLRLALQTIVHGLT
jgi:hypothetical protein